MPSNVPHRVTPARDKSLSRVGATGPQEALSRCVLGVGHSATLEYADTGVPVTLVTSSPKTRLRSTAESQGAPASAPGPRNHSPKTPGPRQRGHGKGDGGGERSSSFCSRTGRSRCHGICFSVLKSDLARCTPLSNLGPPAQPRGGEGPVP